MQAVLSSVNSYQSLCLIQESIFKLGLMLPKHLFATISPRSELLSASKASEFHQKRNPSLSLLQLPGEIWIQRRIDKSYGRDQTHCTPASQVYMGSTTVRANTFLPAFTLSLDNFCETVSWKFWGLQIQQCLELPNSNDPDKIISSLRTTQNKKFLYSLKIKWTWSTALLVASRTQCPYTVCTFKSLC